MVTPIPHRQYYLVRNISETESDEIRSESIGEWHLVHDGEFTVLPVLLNKEPIGAIFGTILDIQGRIEEGTVRIDSIPPDATISGAFERVLHGFLGSYVGVLDSKRETRVYPDATGSLPIVYDKRREIIASSPLVMPGVTHEERFRRDLFEAVRQPLVSRGEDTWLPGTLTYYTGIKRLLPNHHLDLNTWESTRFWPEKNDVQKAAEPTSEVEKIVSELERIFESIVAKYDKPKLSLTAGKDSRSLMAVAREFVTGGEISLYTMGETDFDVDVHIARRLTATAGVNHELLPIVEASDEEQKQWLERTGYTVSSGIKEIYPTILQTDADVDVGGLGGEIVRGYFWKESDDAETELEPTELLRRFHKPEHPELVSTVEEWCEELNEFDPYTVLDLAYQEHRLGCWAGPQHLGLPNNVDYLRPLCYRPIIESMYRQPPEVRRSDRLPEKIVALCWPELNEYPYNSFTDNRRYIAYAKRKAQEARTVVSNPVFAGKYLSKKYLK